ncbi:nucleoside hydrolase [Candidatus Pristimantibacillus sp. PTI5]|uniref:nucleoside hydrolase n=1 Tax=Candidatus Pristimantibacillus sp. PTI5 TaxID=3400422 RepID=UPI003B011B85
MIFDNFSYKVPSQKMIRIITNSDAKNEADDQYAIVHALLSPKFDNRGLIAAHFGAWRTENSMEESYEEIHKILDLMNMKKDHLVYKGAPKSLPDEGTPIPSAGAELIIKEAMSDDPRPLFVTFLGPLTDMASALLMEPRIAEKLTVIWIGGGAYPAGEPEYNLWNDIHAANVVFKSNVPVWQVPKNAYQQVMVSMAELEYRVKPYGELGSYLFEQLVEFGHTEAAINTTIRTGECWCLGDSPAVGLLLCDHEYRYDWVPAPEITPDMRYIHERNNRPIRVYHDVNSRFIMEDFYAKLALFNK